MAGKGNTLRLPEETVWSRCVSFGFRLLYNELAWSYDAVSWAVSLGHWRRWQTAALDFVTGERVLEIAHGPGHSLLALAAQGKQVTGVDLSASMGRLTQARLRRAGVSAPLVRCGVQALPFAAARFDCVLSQFPTSFILEQATLASVHRVLADGGRFVILPEGHLTGEGAVYKAIDWMFEVTGQRAAGEVANLDCVWRPFEVALTAAGFAVKIELVGLEGSEATVIVAEKGK